MWPSSWPLSLRHRLARRASRAELGRLRVAVVGIGQRLRGDDGAGCAVARGLAARLPTAGPVLVLDGGPAPENLTGLLRRHRPALVVLVDAAQMGTTPGTRRWLAWEETTGLSASTHTLPLDLLARYLTEALGTEVALLGIEPGQTAVGARLSPAVARAVAEVTAELAAALQPVGTPDG